MRTVKFESLEYIMKNSQNSDVVNIFTINFFEVTSSVI